MKTVQVFLCLLVACSSASGAREDTIVIENTHVRYTVSAEGRNLAFINRVSGVDYLKGHSVKEVNHENDYQLNPRQCQPIW